jgi:hypothetical protein
MVCLLQVYPSTFRRHFSTLQVDFDDADNVSASELHICLGSYLSSAFRRFVNRRRASSTHDVDDGASVAQLSLTVSFLNQAITTVFTIDEDVGFEVIFGSKWEGRIMVCPCFSRQLLSLMNCVTVYSALSPPAGGNAT